MSLENSTKPNSNLDLNWLINHSPIFAKMFYDTRQRKFSETEYRKLLPAKNLSGHPASPIFSLTGSPLDVSLPQQNP